MTGYTHELVEKDQTFQQFAMSCAKAFGANIMLRDEPSDTPIPDEYKVDDYHTQKIIEIRAKQVEFTAMTKSKRLAWAEREKMNAIAAGLEAVSKNDKNVAKMRATLAQVNRWTPPTPDHEHFKEFMVEQLTKSIEWESDSTFWDRELNKLRAKDAETMVAERFASFTRDITYHEAEHAKEVSRVAERNKWNRDLRDSLNNR